MAKKKKTATRRSSTRRRGSGNLMSSLTEAGMLAMGGIAAVKVGDMLRSTFPDAMMRNGAIAVGGAFLAPMLPASFRMVGIGMAAGGMLNIAASAMPSLGITGPGSMGALSDMSLDELENALLEASDMNGMDDRNAALNGDDDGDDDFDHYQQGLNGMDDRGSVLNGTDDADDADDDFEG